MPRQHGNIAKAGKVKSQTPRVEPIEKPKKPTGRAAKRAKYTRNRQRLDLVPLS